MMMLRRRGTLRGTYQLRMTLEEPSDLSGKECPAGGWSSAGAATLNGLELSRSAARACSTSFSRNSAGQATIALFARQPSQASASC